MKETREIKEILTKHGSDILQSEGIKKEKELRHHRTTTVFAHSLGVAYISVLLAKKLRISINERELVRGALLHDYFLYDWRDPDPSHKLHGFKHAKIALNNADRDFELNDIEKDIIVKHMFPLNIKAPQYRESAIVCVADKICAVCELMSLQYMKE
jgi:uncharacterized protein